MKDLFTSVPLTQYIISGYQEKLQGMPKGEKQFEETDQASEPDLAGMLELPDWEF